MFLMKNLKPISQQIKRLAIRIAAERSITFLGTGPSQPITDRSGKSNRKNTSALIEYKGDSFLIDVSPDFNQDTKFDYLVTTHHHSDAFGGMKEVFDREFVYGVPLSLSKGLEKDGAKWKTKILGRNSRNELGKLSVIPFPVEHAHNSGFPTFGYQFIFDDDYKLTYASDMVEIPNESEKYFNNIDMAVVDGAGWEKNLPTHFGVIPFLKMVKEKDWKIGRVYFVQIGRQVPDHNKALGEMKQINPQALLAFDEQKVTF